MVNNFNITITVYRMFCIHLQNKIPTIVLIDVAISVGPTIAVGSTLPYWLLYAIIFMGISCRDEMFITKNVHISSLALRTYPCFTYAVFPRSASSCASASIAFSPAGVAAQPSPSIFAIIFVDMYSAAG